MKLKWINKKFVKWSKKLKFKIKNVINITTEHNNINNDMINPDMPTNN